LVQIMHAVFKVFQTGKQDGAEATGVPSDAAAGLKIQLGGREDYSPQKLKEEKLGLLATLKTSFKEGVAVFWGKIKWIVSRPPQGENGSRFDNLKVVFNGLFPGSPLSSNK
jgi:hypothetical protein